MTLVDLLGRLESVRIAAENPESYVKDQVIGLKIVDLLVDYIGNEKVTEKVNDILF